MKLKALGFFNQLKVHSLSKIWFQMSTCTPYSAAARFDAVVVPFAALGADDADAFGAAAAGAGGAAAVRRRGRLDTSGCPWV